MKYFKKDACQSCEYFVQHYVCSDKRFTPADAGHCIRTRRRKDRKALSPPCEHWTEQSDEYRKKHEPPEERVIRYVLLSEQ